MYINRTTVGDAASPLIYELYGFHKELTELPLQWTKFRFHECEVVGYGLFKPPAKSFFNHFLFTNIVREYVSGLYDLLHGPQFAHLRYRLLF